MKRVLRFLPLLLLVLLFIPLSAPGPQPGGFGFGGAPRSGSAFAFFELAPQSGTGMGTPCSCANVTGAKGEAVTWARASGATCTKTNNFFSSTGIANGDLVNCGNNLPRVEFAPGGQLGVLQEVARTNSIIRSQELNNIAWSSQATGVAAPTVTADFAAAPDGTTTAERLQIPATTTAQESYRYQTACPVGADVASVYVRGNGSSGTTDLFINLNGGSFACVPCSYVSGSWTRCSIGGTVITSAGNFSIGNESVSGVCSGSARGVQDIFVWGAQCEAGTYATSYIPTVAAAAARVDDAFTAPAIPSVANNGSAAVWFAPQWTGATGPTAALIGGGTAGRYLYAVGSSSAGVRVFDGTNDLATGVSNHTAGQGRRFYSTWTGSTMTLTNVTDTNTVSGAFTGTMSTGALESGSTAWSGVSLGGLLYGICVDPSPSRCR